MKEGYYRLSESVPNACRDKRQKHGFWEAVDEFPAGKLFRVWHDDFTATDRKLVRIDVPEHVAPGLKVLGYDEDGELRHWQDRDSKWDSVVAPELSAALSPVDPSEDVGAARAVLKAAYVSPWDVLRSLVTLPAIIREAERIQAIQDAEQDA